MAHNNVPLSKEYILKDKVNQSVMFSEMLVETSADQAVGLAWQ